MLPIHPPFPPMEALSVKTIPQGAAWQYEPKWDGFRCLVFRDGDAVDLQSKSGQPLARYFPELVEVFRELKARQFVLDGEIVIPAGNEFSFDELLLRVHPAESRVRKLAAAHPARFLIFDLLVDERGKSLVREKLSVRRPRLESFAASFLPNHLNLALSPATTDYEEARKWFEAAGGNMDGIIAKRLDVEYRSGDRTGMEKIKPNRTVECVVGGFRYGTDSDLVGSLLLGLYDDDGILHHVGFTSGIKQADKPDLTQRLEKLVKPPGFTGRAPGGPSRWSSKRSGEWQPLAPKLVVEVAYDHFTGGRFRHGAKFLRWRPDKAPEQCRMDQVTGRKKRDSLQPIVAAIS